MNYDEKPTLKQRLLNARLCLKDEYRKCFPYNGMHWRLLDGRLYSDDFGLYLAEDEDSLATPKGISLYEVRPKTWKEN